MVVVVLATRATDNQKACTESGKTELGTEISKRASKESKKHSQKVVKTERELE